VQYATDRPRDKTIPPVFFLAVMSTGKCGQAGKKKLYFHLQKVRTPCGSLYCFFLCNSCFTEKDEPPVFIMVKRYCWSALILLNSLTAVVLKRIVTLAKRKLETRYRRSA